MNTLRNPSNHRRTMEQTAAARKIQADRRSRERFNPPKEGEPQTNEDITREIMARVNARWSPEVREECWFSMEKRGHLYQLKAGSTPFRLLLSWNDSASFWYPVETIASYLFGLEQGIRMERKIVRNPEPQDSSLFRRISRFFGIE